MAIVTQNPDEIKTSETVSSFMRRFGIPETELIKAEMLDVEGYDAEIIVDETIRNLPSRKA